MSTLALATSGRALPRTLRRVLIAAAALLAVAAMLGLVSVLLGPGAARPAIAPRNPFGTGLREAAPGAGGIGGYILAIQSEFYRAMQGALGALKRDGGSAWTLLGIGFVYGVFHAAGPGHGKAVVAGYLLASRRTLVRGIGLSLAAAFVQAVVAIGIVLVLTTVLKATAASVSATANAVEVASFGGLAVFGLALLWRKTARLVPPLDGGGHASGEVCETCDGCGHGHVPGADEVERLTTWRESAAVVVAAGSRPCSGAIIILVFAASQSLLPAGIAATFAMAAGTAITTGALASLAVLAKGVALRVATRGPGARLPIIPVLEVGAAAFVVALGAMLLLGTWSGGGGS